MSFSNDWLKIHTDGHMIVLGSNLKCEGHAWDGGSPKFYFRNLHFGMPDGIMDEDSSKLKT